MPAVNAGDYPTVRMTALTEPFWNACERNILTVQRCERCRQWNFPPVDSCRICHSGLVWSEVTGQGRIYSFSVVWRAPVPAFTVPYAVAIIEMHEGFTIMSNIVGSPAGDIAIGAPVTVTFVKRGEIAIPMFRLSRE